MSLWVVVVVQWLHIAAGVTWIGSAIGLDVVMWPQLLRMQPGAARELHDRVIRVVTPVAGAAGALTIVLGIVRGTVLGPIASFQFLFGQPYGITWLVALALAVVVVVEGVLWERRVEGGLVWVGEELHPGAARRVFLQCTAELGAFAVILICMVLMAFGL